VGLLGRCKAAEVDFLLVSLLTSPPGAVGEKGDDGVEPAGEDGTEPDPTETSEGRRTVMVREMGMSIGGSDRPEKELNLRSLPRPESGVGPASVSSQSLSRKPIIIIDTCFLSFFFGVTTGIRWGGNRK